MKNPLTFFLWPISVLYGSVLQIRNILFDLGIKTVYTSDKTKVIGVGNLSVGGTGKTPFSELILSFLAKSKSPIYFVSRGYGRQTKGLRFANKEDDYLTIGDEPMQVKRKFINYVQVIVAEKRKWALQKIDELANSKNIAVLDDNYQHRYVKSDLQFLLTTYQKPYWNDYVLPMGMLREWRLNTKRANYLIITKCPENLSCERADEIKVKSGFDKNKVFFTSVKYADSLQHLYRQETIQLQVNNKVIAFSATASNELFESKLAASADLLHFFKFRDHKNFSNDDVQSIINLFDDCTEQYGEAIVLITTEKDAVRLQSHKLNKQLQKLPLYYWSIKAHVLFNNEPQLKKIVLQYDSDD